MREGCGFRQSPRPIETTAATRKHGVTELRANDYDGRIDPDMLASLLHKEPSFAIELVEDTTNDIFQTASLLGVHTPVPFHRGRDVLGKR